MQQKETTNRFSFADDFQLLPKGRILAVDPGTKRCGLAVCDELQVTTRPLPLIERTSWKKLLVTIRSTIDEFDAKALVLGLPLDSEGNESPMSEEARHMAEKLSLSLDIPIFLQDERVTSYEAKGRLWDQGHSLASSRKLVDSTAAAIILSDFLDRISSLPRT